MNLTVTGVDRAGSRERLGRLLQYAVGNDCAVMAFNVVDPASMQGVLDAAETAQVPVVVQLSVRSARQWGVEAALACHAEASSGRVWPSVLHLDHCVDREFAERCLRAGWDSVLFDASGLAYETAVRQTAELVELAAEFGGDVEGEFEAIPRVGEAPVGGSGEDVAVGLERVNEFIGRTGVTCFSPALGTAHGAYAHQPVVEGIENRARRRAASLWRLGAEQDGKLQIYAISHDQQVYPRAGCEFEERGQRQPYLLAICDNRLTVLADPPAGVGENQIGTSKLLEHRAHSTRDRSRRGIVQKFGIEASRKLQVVGPGALAARDLFADVSSNNARHRQYHALAHPIGPRPLPGALFRRMQCYNLQVSEVQRPS